MTKLTREDVIKSIADGNKDFKGWDLSGLDLSNVKFLQISNLSGANLSGTNLFGAILERVWIRETYLEGANLSERAYF